MKTDKIAFKHWTKFYRDFCYDYNKGVAAEVIGAIGKEDHGCSTLTRPLSSGVKDETKYVQVNTVSIKQMPILKYIDTNGQYKYYWSRRR